MSTEIDVRSTRWQHAADVLGVVLCVVVDAAVVFAVFESPFGTIFILDDSPPDGYVLAPLVAGAAVGALQRIAFGTSSTIVAAIVAALAGAASLFFVFPAVVVAAGSVLGAIAATMVRRRSRRWSTLAVIVLVATGTITTGYGLSRTGAHDQPLVEVTAVSGGSSVVIDPQERSKEGMAVLGDVTRIGGCLGIVDRTAGRHEYVVAWPRGTTGSYAPYVLTYEGRRYRLGDFVAVRGGVPITMPVDLDAYAPDLPASCRGRDIILAG